MSELQATGANAEQIEFWNGKAAVGWVDSQEHMDELLEPLSQTALARAAAKTGELALDVGCGCGATSMALARAGAIVTGIDISAPMLTSARSRAAKAKLEIDYRLADASVERFNGTYDLLFSRFGVMFFADAVAAFTNLRTALKPGGRLTFICWQAARENAWMAAPATAIAAFLPPAPPVDPRAPGPFAFADRSYLVGVLGQAGFADVQVEGTDSQLRIGRSVDEALNFTMRTGPLSRPLAALEGDAKRQATDALRRLLNQHERNGAVRLGAKCWIVSGCRLD